MPTTYFNSITANAGTNLNTSALALETGGNLAAILAKITADPATQTTLAAILAKISADPATQTTLAAVLAKISSNPALETGGNLAAILAKITSDPATQTTLAAVLAKITADPSTATLQTALNNKDFATSAKQDTGNASLSTIAGKDFSTSAKQDTGNTSLSTIAGKDFATQTTLASFLSANHVDLAAILSKLSSDPATETTLNQLLKPADTLTKVSTLDSITNPVNVNFANANSSAFGDLISVGLRPVVQMDFVYGLNSQTTTTTTANSATVDTNASRLRLQSGTNVAGSAIFQSKKTAKYRAGEGMVGRFTALFTTGVANSKQITGIGNSTDGYFVGYNGISFGFMLKTGGSETWIAQTTWNGDKCNGTGASGFTWNTTKGTPIQIIYPFLGYGNIKFMVQNPDTSAWILAHTIKYANTTTAVQVTNPNLGFYSEVTNSGNNTNLIMYSGSAGIFISGERTYVGNPKWSTDVNLKAITTSEAAILSIRNATTYNGVANKSVIRLNSISVSGNSNTLATIRFRIGATLGGSPSFAAISGTTADSGITITSGNSVASVDVAATTSSAGTYFFNIAIGANGSQVIDVSNLDLFIYPAETLSICGIGSANTNVGISVNWTEDI